MANNIPFSGATPEAGGVLLPTEQGEILTNGLLREAGALQLAGDARTTTSRKTQFPIWLGRPTAGPVGEGQAKPVTGGEFDQTELNIKKFASIVLFTDEQIEDLANGDMNVLVDSGVREALADSIDAHAIGMDGGTPIGAPTFDSFLANTNADPVNIDSSKPDGLQRAVSAAWGKLEASGYGNPANVGVLLYPGFNQAIRDARDKNDRPLYHSGDSVDPLYGLSRAFSTNLGAVAAPGESPVTVGFVIHKPNLHVRIRQDVQVRVSTEATIKVGQTDRHLFQENLTAIRYELRLGVLVHDLDRAVIPIQVPAAS